jgi:hypothetical protein
VAALRLGLMRILGIDDPAERQHELAELGAAAEANGPISALCGATDLHRMLKLYEATLAELDQKVAGTPPSDPKLPYYRSLVILTKKVELDLRNQVDALTRLYRDLEHMHDLVHEIYPVE